MFSSRPRRPAPSDRAEDAPPLSRHQTSSGIKSFVILVAFCFLFAVALLLNVQYLYIMAVTLALLPAVSYALGSLLAARYAATRHHLATIPEGRQQKVRLQIAARGGLPQTTLRVVDTVPAALAPNGAPEPAPPDTWDGRRGERTYFIEPSVRGVYSIGPARLEIFDPLGLFTFHAQVPVTTQIVVHPTPMPMRERHGGGAGAYGLRERDGKTRRGEGSDFHGVREYRPGDALRRVHWRTSARRNKLVVVEYEKAYQQNAIIALDLGDGSYHGVGRESGLEYAVKVAATIADRTLRDGGGVTLATQNGTLVIRPGDGDLEAARFSLFDLLARAQANSTVSLAGALRGIDLGDATQICVLTGRGDPELSALLTDRVRHGDDIRIFFFEPRSFGGAHAVSPAVAGARLQVVTRAESPWVDGGSRLEYLLHQTN